MQTGFILIYFVVPICLEGCCVRNYQKKRTGLQKYILNQHFRVVEGEHFLVPCVKSVNDHVEMDWSGSGECKEEKTGSSLKCGETFIAEAQHSGNYTCLNGGSKILFYLQVVAKVSLPCFNANESSKSLLIAAGGEIPCPGLNCSNNTDMRWYKGNKTMSKQRRRLCEEDGLLRLCQVGESDGGVYFCDRQIVEKGVKWTFRRAVNIKVVPNLTVSDPPRIARPEDNTTEEVELGQSHTLICKAYFSVAINFSADVQWYMNYGGNLDNNTPLHMENPQHKQWVFKEVEVTQTAILEEVNLHHLNHTYTCIARNTVGDCRATIKLKKKIKVKWPSLVGYPIVCLLLVACVGFVLHVKWIELQLFYRSHFYHGECDKEKEFDVFLSYVWSPPSAEVLGGGTFSTQSQAGTDERACLSIMDPLNTVEGKGSQTPLEELLPQVIEERWGYRLCLLERDILPGGAYTNDVVQAIQGSHMLICVLSADYFCDSNAVFVLESGIQALLQNSTPKLLLIWTSRASISLSQPDPPLPTVVQRALKVLPSLKWTSRKPTNATCSFWKSLRKAMPDHKVKILSPMNS